jgi:hypothetical protein
MVRLRINWRLWAAVLSLTAMLSPGQTGAEEARWDVAAANPAASACDDACFTAPPRCPLYFRIDGVMLRRDVHGATDAATLDNTDNLALSTRDLDMPFNAGPRFLVGHTFDDSPYQVEFSYFWLSDLNESAAVRDNTLNVQGTLGNLFSPFTGFGLTPVVGLDYNNLVSIREISFMQNMELNLRRQLPMPQERLATSFLIGARFVGIREQFDYFSQSDSPAGGATNAVRVRTRNELYGFQIGQLFQFNVDRQWWIDTELKGAICNNAGGQSTVYTQAIAGVPTTSTSSLSRSGTSFVGDIALTLVCRPTAHLTTRIGYQAIWMTGMAIAAKNMNTDVDILIGGPPQLNLRGTVVYHGPQAGLEITW